MCAGRNSADSTTGSKSRREIYERVNQNGDEADGFVHRMTETATGMVSLHLTVRIIWIRMCMV